MHGPPFGLPFVPNNPSSGPMSSETLFMLDVCVHLTPVIRLVKYSESSVTLNFDLIC